MPLSCQKHLFALDPDVHYLNCGAYSPLLNRSVEKGVEGLLRKAQTPYVFRPADHFDTAERIRGLFSSLIGADDPLRIALIPAVSYGMAIVANNLHRWPGLHTKKHIVLIGEEFPNNVYAFDRVCAAHGLTVVTVQKPEASEHRGAEWNARILEAITPETALVVASQAHWIYGTVFHLEAISQRCREAGAMMVVDATQSVGAMPFDVPAIQPDAVICAAYKWLLGPYGIGAAWFGPFFDEGTPVEEGWMNRMESEQFAQLTRYERAYRPKAQRYNVGEYSQFAQLPALEAALEQLCAWTPASIQEYCQTLSAAFALRWEALGVRLESPTHRAGHLFGLQLPLGTDRDIVVQRLAEHRIFVSPRGEVLRISPNVYNDANNLEMLTTVLEAVCKNQK